MGHYGEVSDAIKALKNDFSLSLSLSLSLLYLLFLVLFKHPLPWSDFY